jgi:hypothetical protein
MLSWQHKGGYAIISVSEALPANIGLKSPKQSSG